MYVQKVGMGIAFYYWRRILVYERMYFMVKTLRNPRYFNAIYQILLAMVIAQQIYAPQGFKYVHLALVFIRMIISEAYDAKHRFQKNEEYFILAILVTTLVSIVEKILTINLGLVYLLALAVAVVLMGTFLKTIIDDSKNYQGTTKFHAKHVEMLQKGKVFTNGILYLMLGICGLILLYVSYEIIKLLS